MWSQTQQIAPLWREVDAQAILAVGGGSPIDAAKGMAVMAVNDGHIADFCEAGVDPWPNTPLPIFALPTTAGTGSEVSAAAMINRPTINRKVDIFGPSILPKVAILDPELTRTLPPALTAYTGIDALCHAIEAYTCARANPISDAIAERSIELIAQNLRKAYANGNNLEARGNMLLASAMAVIAAANAGGLGVIHSLAQTLGGYYNAPHGVAIGVCFHHGLEYNMIAVPEKYAKVSALLGTNTTGMSLMTAARSLIDPVLELHDDVGMNETLRGLGAKSDDFPKLAELCMLDGCTPPNPRTLTAKAFESLYWGMYM